MTRRHQSVTKMDVLHRGWRREADYKEAYDVFGEESDFARSRSDSMARPSRSRRVARG